MRIPIDVGWNNGYCISLLFLNLFWNDAIKNGFDPEELLVKCYEINNGYLAVCFENQSNEIVFAKGAPPGFWWSLDGKILPDMMALDRENADALNLKLGMKWYKKSQK